MSSRSTQRIDAVMLFLATVLVHGLFLFCLLAVFETLGSPVGAGKREAFSILIMPVAMVFIGWVQGRVPLIVNAFGSALIWVERWRFQSSYFETEHVGSLAKELPWDVFTTALGSFIICALAAGIWNASLKLRERDLLLNIPFRGKTAIWK